MSTHVISMGQWMNTLMNSMDSAVDGDVFSLPTAMHLHAYNIVKEDFFPNKTFTVELAQQTEV